MLERLRNQIGTAGLLVAIVALVAALGGGAYAATSNSGKATASAKGKQGKQGKPGKTGPAGPQGPAGPAGAKGDKGDTGATGATGAQGPAGPAGATGPAGKNGTTGFTETLPGEKTETGTYSFGILPNLPIKIWRVPISFAIPLAAPIASSGCTTVVPGPPTKVAATCRVHYIGSGGKEIIETGFSVYEEMGSSVCTGTAAAPTAPPGDLCIYAGKEEVVKSASSRISTPIGLDEPEGAATSGAQLAFKVEEEGQGWGTWAVTAEVE